MKRIAFSVIIGCQMFLAPIPQARASGIPVVDVAAIGNLIVQIEHLKTMIDQLNSLTDYGKLDHINLAGGKFRRFLTEYKKLYSQIIDEIENYQSGGLMGQISRLDEVYFPYHDQWEDTLSSAEAEASDPLHRELAKQILWTRIQFKHAAMVGAKIRDSLPDTQEQINVLLDDTAQAVGVMQSIKIGNELTGMVAKSLQTLNISLTEQIQAQAAEGLEKNHKEGLKINRAREAIKGWGVDTYTGPVAPLNPFERY